MPVVGFLELGRPESNIGAVSGFRRGLADAGYVEGRNLEIDFRWANTEGARLRTLADALVRRQVAVIAAPGGGSAMAAKAPASSIPIVIAGDADPVKLGFVVSLVRPGGNVTGVIHI
jgi:putative ABC transport system substrate-binding protein